jgi:hypothetical protein
MTAEQGQKLLEEIQPRILAGETVTIDLAGVNILLSIFLNNAVGPLFIHFDRQRLDRLLKFENQSDSQRLTLENSMRSAESYHRDPDVKRAVDDSLVKMFEERE